MYKLANIMLLGMPWISYKIFGKLTPAEREETRIIKNHVRVRVPTFGAKESEFKKGMTLLLKHSSFDGQVEWKDTLVHASRHGFRMYVNDIGLALAKKLNNTRSFDIEIHETSSAICVFLNNRWVSVADRGVCGTCHEEQWYHPSGRCDFCGGKTMSLEVSDVKQLKNIEKVLSKEPTKRDTILSFDEEEMFNEEW